MNLVKTLKKWRQPGRVFTLQTMLFFLLLGTSAYFIVNMHKLTVDYQNAGSLAKLWEIEWRSGGVFLDDFRSGFFQAFLLIIGWSVFFRLAAGKQASNETHNKACRLLLCDRKTKIQAGLDHPLAICTSLRSVPKE